MSTIKPSPVVKPDISTKTEIKPVSYPEVNLDAFLNEMTEKTGMKYRVRVNTDGPRVNGKSFFKARVDKISPEGDVKVVFEIRMVPYTGKYEDDFFFVDYDKLQKRFLIEFFM